jgi:hypothetical protein
MMVSLAELYLLRFYLVKLLCAGSLCIPSDDVEGGYRWEVQTPDGWVPYQVS